MECPICNGPMWDNRGKKRNPKAPDFKCKDKACDGAIWPPRDKKLVQAPVNGKTNNDSFRTMVLSYCKDIVVAEIAKGEVKEPFKRVADGYKVLLMAYNYPFGKPQPKPIEEPPIDEEQPF